MSFDILSQPFGGGILLDNGPYYNPHAAQECVRHISEFPAEYQRPLQLISGIMALKSGDFKTARYAINKIDSNGHQQHSSSIERFCSFLLELFTLLPPVNTYGTFSGDVAIQLDGFLDKSLLQIQRMILRWRQDSGTTGESRPWNQWNRVEQIELELIMEMMSIVSTFQGHAASMPNKNYPVFRPAVDSPLYQSPSELAAQVTSVIEEFRRLSNLLSFSDGLKYSDILDLAAKHCAGGQIEQTTFEETIGKYPHDALMKGRIAIICADSIVSPATSSPVLLNVCAVLSFGNYANHTSWTALQDNMKLVDNQLAQDYLDKAYSAFQEAECPYGVASVLLRRACLMYGSCMTTGTALSPSIIEQSQALLEEAESLFNGNHTWQFIVESHKMILAMIKLDGDMALRIATSISDRALQLENTNLLSLIGKFLLSLGRQQTLLFARSDLALACWQCASILGQGYCYNAIDMVSSFWQTAVFKSLKDDVKAYVYLKTTYNKVAKFVSDLSLVDESRKNSTTTVKRIFILPFRNLAYQILEGGQNDDFRECWNHDFEAEFQMQTTEIDDEQASTCDNSTTHNLDETSAAFRSLNITYSIKDRFTAADAAFSRENEAGNIQEARLQMQKFVSDLQDNSSSNIFKRYAFLRLGDFASMRSLTDYFLDPHEHDFGIVPKLGHGEVWSRSLSKSEFEYAIDCDDALLHCVMSQDWTKGELVLKRFEDQIPDYLRVEAQRVDSGYRIGHAALILEHCQVPDLTRALKLLLQARRQILDLQSGTEDIDTRSNVSNFVYTAAFYYGLSRICIKLRNIGLKPLDLDFANLDLPTAESFDEVALYFLEEFRASSVKQSLQLDEACQSKEDDHHAKHDVRLARILSALPKRQAQETKELALLMDSPTVASQFNNVSVLQLRAVQSDVNTLKADIASLPEDALLIVMIVNDHGKLRFGVTSDGIKMASFSEDEDCVRIRDSVAIINSRFKRGARFEDAESSPAWQHELTDLQEPLDYLTSIVLDPFSELIAQKQHIIFSISYPLTTFPFAILPYNGQPLILSKAISTVPSLSIFSRLYARQQTLKRRRVALVTRPETRNEWQRTREPRLPYSAIEALAISALDPSHRLRPSLSSTMNAETLRSILVENDVVHIGTHGYQHDGSPWLANLSLEKPLRVLDLDGVRSRCGLLILAACTSGLGAHNWNEESIGFSRAILSGCANAFVGSLWKVSDVASMLLMVYFYQELWKCKEGTVLAEVWRRAQIKLYNCDTAEKVTRELDMLKDCVSETRKLGVNVETIIKNPEQYLVTSSVCKTGFNHPFYWASFVMMGNGAARISDE